MHRRQHELQLEKISYPTMEKKRRRLNGAFFFQMWWNDCSVFQSLCVLAARQMTWQSCNWMIMWICLSERWEGKVWTQKCLFSRSALSKHVHLRSPFKESCLICYELFCRIKPLPAGIVGRIHGFRLFLSSNSFHGTHPLPFSLFGNWLKMNEYFI